MHQDRVTTLMESHQKNADYVLYWMQQSQRISFNHALNKAIEIANQNKLPVIVYFTLSLSYLGANLRHYRFMIEGLQFVKKTLNEKGITFVILNQDDEIAIEHLFLNAHTLVMDYGYLKPQRKWRRKWYDYIKKNHPNMGVVVVESDVIVPVKKAYPKLAYGAFALRPHLMKQLVNYRDYQRDLDVLSPKICEVRGSMDFNEVTKAIQESPIDQSVKPYGVFKGGYLEAVQHLENFIESRISDYGVQALQLETYSFLSPYLHFGQISSLEVFEIVTEYLAFGKIKQGSYDKFVEQLVVRRELAFNFVTYQKDYDVFESITEPWAYDTMKIHENDLRDVTYSRDVLENGLTTDIYFNSAMKEMRITGFMTGYMRMYWAKKIIEWSPSMKEAFARILYLNNKYFLDGRDPNSYVNIAWCFGKMDRPFKERKVFGKLRYMNALGLERKFDMTSYVKKMSQLKE